MLQLCQTTQGIFLEPSVSAPQLCQHSDRTEVNVLLQVVLMSTSFCRNQLPLSYLMSRLSRWLWRYMNINSWNIKVWWRQTGQAAPHQRGLLGVRHVVWHQLDKDRNATPTMNMSCVSVDCWDTQTMIESHQKFPVVLYMLSCSCYLFFFSFLSNNFARMETIKAT